VSGATAYDLWKIQERGFLFASAVVAVCLVILIGIMGASVILWDMGFAPEYTN
jgi:hypothetical protein